MPDIYVADATGTMRKVVGLQVADASGTFRPSTDTQVADSTGTLRKVWPLGPSISSFTALPGSPAYSRVNLAWQVTGTAHVELYRTGVTTALYKGTASSYVFTATPGATYSFTLKAVAADGTVTSSQPVSIKAAALPAPTGLKYDSKDHDSVRILWTNVTGATGYDVVNVNNNGVIASSSSSPVTVSGLVPESMHKWAVRSKLSGVNSSLSASISFNMAEHPVRPGDYTFNAVSGATWQTGESGGSSAGWRSSADGLYHGNGNDFGSTRGNQTGVIFYGNRPFTKLKGGKVESIMIYLYRTDDSGYSSDQLCRWGLHNYTSQPSGSPLGGIDYTHETGYLGRGEGKWIELPASWGQKLVDGTMAGIAWGNVNSTQRYMHATKPGSTNSNGRIIIAIA